MLAVLLIALGLSECPTGIYDFTNETNLNSFADCVFDGKQSGGLVIFDASQPDSSLTLVNCTFTDFTQSQFENGGVILVDNVGKCDLIINETTFTRCQVTATKGNGGAIYMGGSTKTENIENSTCKIYTCTFTDCQAAKQGACIVAKYVSDCTVKYSTFTNFKTTNKNSDGGAVFIAQKSGYLYTDPLAKVVAAYIEKCTFITNDKDTGALVVKVYRAYVKKSTFQNIKGDINAVHAAIYLALVANQDLSITNCDFIDNSNGKGAAGIYLTTGRNFILSDCTFNEQGGNDLLASYDGRFYGEITRCSFSKNANENTIEIVTKTGINGSLLFAQNCFYSPTTNCKSVKCQYIQIDEKCRIYTLFDLANCFDSTDKASAMNCNATIQGNIFNCAYCRPLNVQFPPPIPEPHTNPASCPIFFQRIQADEVFDGCKYTFQRGTKPLLNKINVGTDPSITLQNCVFDNIYHYYYSTYIENGGAILFTYGASAKNLIVSNCQFTNCGTTAYYGGCFFLEFKSTDANLPIATFDKCTFNNIYASQRGAAYYSRGVDQVKVTSCKFYNSFTLSTGTEGGILYNRPKSGNSGPGILIVDNCRFNNTNRGITAKVVDVNISNTKFNFCYHPQQDMTGACIFIPKQATGTKLGVLNCRFNSCGYFDTDYDGTGGAICIGDATSLYSKDNRFDTCISKTGGGIYIMYPLTDTAIIDHNLFQNGNGDIVFNKGTTGTIKNCQFVKSGFRSCFYSKGSTVTFSNNCFQTKNEEISYALHIYVIGSTITIDDDNCFDKPKSESINSTSDSTITVSDSVFSCTNGNQCPQFPADPDENQGGAPSKSGSMPQSTLIGIIVAVIVVVIIIIVVVVVFAIKKNKKAVSTDPGDYNTVKDDDSMAA